MKKALKISTAVIGIPLVIYAALAFALKDPAPDFTTENTENLLVTLENVESAYQKEGMFKSVVNFRQTAPAPERKEFYGQQISIEGNNKLNRIDIGITSNLISRIELWNDSQMLEARELGFMDKMSWGDHQKMVVEFYDNSNNKYPEKSKIRMRFYSGNGFTGDIGTISFDLSSYGDLSGAKEIGLFAKSLETPSLSQRPEFTNFRLWKNWNSAD